MIRVLVVDDSAVVRKVLTDQLSQEADIEVVGSAVDPYVARERIAQLAPDVITLDIELPRMDGLEFLDKLMQHHPLPVVVVSSLTPEGSEAALRAFELGAVEVVPKPGNQYSVPEVRSILARAIRAAARSKPKARHAGAGARLTPRPALRMTDTLIALGASTGGPAAIEHVLSRLPADMPGMVIVQHMPLGFTGPFAKRISTKCALTVREARAGDVVAPGLVLIAPAGLHMQVVRSGAQVIVRLNDAPRVHHQRPAVDVLFMSVAQRLGRNAIGVLLTGIGSDGAVGLKAMRDAGAHTIAESEESSVVYGMPRAAAELDAVDRVLALDAIPDALVRATH